MKRINSLLPEIRVHTWGGFGSQLFTAHLILRLKYRFPGRNIKVIIELAKKIKKWLSYILIIYVHLNTMIKTIELRSIASMSQHHLIA